MAGCVTNELCAAAGTRRRSHGGFHNARTGCCFPSYEAIAAKAECARSTVAEALKALEWAGVLTWQNRITRIPVREPRAGVHGARLVSFPGVQGVRRNLFSPRGIVSRFGSRDIFAGQRDKPCG